MLPQRTCQGAPRAAPPRGGMAQLAIFELLLPQERKQWLGAPPPHAPLPLSSWDIERQEPGRMSGDRNSSLPRDPVTGVRKWIGAKPRRNGSKPAGVVTAIGTAGDGRLKKYKRKLLLKGISSLDKRGEVAKLYRTMRAELLDMLGPEEDITPTQRHLVEIITRGLVYLGHVDATLLAKMSLTNGTKRKALPLLNERMSMSKIVSSQLQLLGLEKRTRVRTLAEDLAASPELLSKEGQPL